MRSRNLAKVLSFFSLGLAGLAVCIGTDAYGYEALDHAAMFNVRGALPTCIANYSTWPCSESNSGGTPPPPGACSSKNGTDQATCQALPCLSGCDGSGTNDYCNASVGPWNNRCVTATADPTGCGHTFDPLSQSCQWSAITLKCSCTGVSTEIDCPRNKATGIDGNCK